jgi:hypothetical protein
MDLDNEDLSRISLLTPREVTFGYVGSGVVAMPTGAEPSMAISINNRTSQKGGCPLCYREGRGKRARRPQRFERRGRRLAG